MGGRFWVGCFTYAHASRTNWVMERQFYGVHDKCLFPSAREADEVILYTSEYHALAKFRLSQLKAEWHIATAHADLDLCRDLVSRSLRAQEAIRQLSQAYKESAPASLPSELKLYADAFNAGHGCCPKEFFYHDELEEPSEGMVLLFIPSIHSLYVTELRYENAMEVARQRELDYVCIEDLEPPQGFYGHDGAEAQWMLEEELAEDAESYARSEEEGWFYADEDDK